MAIMNRLPLMFLCLATGAAALTTTPDAKPERFEPGRFSFVVPSTARVDHRADFDSSATNIEVRYGLYWNVDTFSWLAHMISGVPASAQEYVEYSSKLDVDDSRLPKPPQLTEFQGYPAWIMTRSYTNKPRPKRGGDRHITESFLAIQRRWGYVVVRSMNDTEFLKMDEAKYQAFLADLKLLPEPPGSPWMLGVLAAVLLILGATLAIRARRQ